MGAAMTGSMEPLGTRWRTNASAKLPGNIAFDKMTIELGHLRVTWANELGTATISIRVRVSASSAKLGLATFHDIRHDTAHAGGPLRADIKQARIVTPVNAL